jgi:spore coat polysaccharide biosynthesis protein SpsF
VAVLSPDPVRAILQARMSSSRLPGKAMLPLAGVPMAVLCARRLRRGSWPLVVATSTNADDDVLAGALSADGATVVRGPLEDVRARFLAATADLGEDAICVRLTGDNPVPDGEFVQLCVAHFRRAGLSYLGAGNGTAPDGLPYGVACEVFRVSALREAARDADSPREREHVTPAIRARHANSRVSFQPLGGDLSRLRCTVDTRDDYDRMAALFSGHADPVAVSWRMLCQDLRGAPH